MRALYSRLILAKTGPWTYSAGKGGGYGYPVGGQPENFVKGPPTTIVMLLFGCRLR